MFRIRCHTHSCMGPVNLSPGPAYTSTGMHGVPSLSGINSRNQHCIGDGSCGDAAAHSRETASCSTEKTPGLLLEQAMTGWLIPCSGVREAQPGRTGRVHPMTRTGPLSMHLSSHLCFTGSLQRGRVRPRSRPGRQAPDPHLTEARHMLHRGTQIQAARSWGYAKPASARPLMSQRIVPTFHSSEGAVPECWGRALARERA